MKIVKAGVRLRSLDGACTVARLDEEDDGMEALDRAAMWVWANRRLGVERIVRARGYDSAFVTQVLIHARSNPAYRRKLEQVPVATVLPGARAADESRESDLEFYTRCAAEGLRGA